MCYLEPLDDGLPMRQAGEWAEEKLDYLARYIDLVVKAMHTKFSMMSYIDLMCGLGKNRVKEVSVTLFL